MSELCAKYSMIPKERPASLYDTFLFNDELDMLEERPLFPHSYCKIDYPEHKVIKPWTVACCLWPTLPISFLPITATGVHNLGVVG